MSMTIRVLFWRGGCICCNGLFAVVGVDSLIICLLFDGYVTSVLVKGV